MVSPTPSSTAAKSTASSAKTNPPKNPPPGGDKKSPPEVAVAAPGSLAGPNAAVQQKQLAEFNQWLLRWNNYQQHLAHYWQGRYHALYQQVAASGGGKIKGGKKGRNKSSMEGVAGDKVEIKWNMRFQECKFTLYCC